ncbi:hypothetical protein FOVSG1_000894 [Fusarium oxysporum f. sp. vasinfectum]
MNVADLAYSQLHRMGPVVSLLLNLSENTDGIPACLAITGVLHLPSLREPADNSSSIIAIIRVLHLSSAKYEPIQAQEW